MVKRETLQGVFVDMEMEHPIRSGKYRGMQEEKITSLIILLDRLKENHTQQRVRAGKGS